MKPFLSACLAFAVGTLAAGSRAADHPNILWITSEDHGQQMGCYGDALARTPNVDALAAKGMLFRNVWSNAPVCAAARTTIISGLLAPSLGAEHMRSEVAMPVNLRMYPQHLREAGYYCTNNSKEDYNLTKPGQVWDDSSAKAQWRNRPAGKPFFAIFNSTLSHESQIIKRPHDLVTDPAKVRVPAYHPDTPEVRQDWAQYYDIVSAVDAVAGEKLRELAEAGVAEDTIVFYYADHGAGLPRSKRWPSDSGLRVPLVVYFPAKWRHLAPKEYAPGVKSDRLVSFVDLAPTLLSLAGVRPPATMQGKAFAGPFQTEPQPYLYGFRGRMDERYDLVRSLTDGRYVYLRNYMPYRSQGQHVNTQFLTPTTQVWRRLYDEGKATPAQAIFWREPKDPEELYDLRSDPDEVRNLAADPAARSVLEQFRAEHRAHAARIRDLGFLTEAEVHARSGKRAPYDVLAADAAYPFARVFQAADRATLPQPGDVGALRGFLGDPDSGVRYWGAIGAMVRGASAVTALLPELRRAATDVAPSVRIAAAEALVRFGGPAEVQLGFDALKASADPTKTSAYAGIAALNAIDALGAKAAPLHAFIKAMPSSDPQAVARGDGYVARLQAYLGGGQGGTEDGDDAPKKKRKKKAE